jgi:hypothetical protein
MDQRTGKEAMRVVSTFAIIACIAVAGLLQPRAPAQVPGGGGGVAVAFRNELNTPVIVQGVSLINGMKKAGQAMIILPGKTGAENNIPMGSVRFYTVVDANQPARIKHILDAPVNIGAQDLNLRIRGMAPKVFLEAAQ